MNNPGILYVEDEAALARITSDTLRRNDFNVTLADNGLTALELFKTHSYDLLVVDVMMPKMDGYTLVKEIRKINREIPVIFLTARVLTEDVVKGFETGGNDYLRKPFSIEELIVRINELLKRSAAPAKEPVHVYELGSYVFNSLKMELVHPEETIQLTHRENEILKRLVQKKNEVTDGRQLLLELWGDDGFYNARSLNVFITKMRKYFHRDDSIAIVNVRAVGYKLIVG
jgi:DNA-binding response OmpR family regulator